MSYIGLSTMLMKRKVVIGNGRKLKMGDPPVKQGGRRASQPTLREAQQRRARSDCRRVQPMLEGGRAVIDSTARSFP
jgi:hypothetical protein